ncbi:sel1 repeat family protein [Frateuria sp. MAH-13]|uniref:Sel1 repeat family protein n=1 Tax=Frateuria flava TaxID=2821489 RepID=A0ABS4DLL5_9GAMM|nr:sel1 repeat family protein [Frateuria flava]MBP1473936.1 sel1 repeat family protein [Frateuria flava]
MARNLLFCLVFGLAAQVARAGAPTPPASTGAEAPITLAELGKLGCAPGLERFLPGVYYYCVGARDLANHRDASGVGMLKLAAAWGSKPAQFTLGVGYFNGDIVARDRARGLAWLGLAAERRDPNYQAVLRSAWQQATPAEQVQAGRLWRAMLPTYGDARAARRAERRYRHERDRLAGLQTSGRQVCIAGLTQRDIAPIPTPSRDTTLSPFQLSTGCPGGAQASVVVHRLDGFAGSLFEGLEGHVTVGPLSPVRDQAEP